MAESDTGGFEGPGTCVSLNRVGWLKLVSKRSVGHKALIGLLIRLGKAIKPSLVFRNNLTSVFHSNRAADPAMLDMGSTISPLIAHCWSGSRSIGWYLNFLAVDPAYQNQGYGSTLVAWGLEQAKKEKISVSVISGEGKDNFYRRCGFHVEVGRSTEGVGNPLKNKTIGGAILFPDSATP